MAKSRKERKREVPRSQASLVERVSQPEPVKLLEEHNRLLQEQNEILQELNDNLKPDQREKRRVRIGQWVLGVIAIVGLTVSLLAWLYPRQASDEKSKPATERKAPPIQKKSSISATQPAPNRLYQYSAKALRNQSGHPGRN